MLQQFDQDIPQKLHNHALSPNGLKSAAYINTVIRQIAQDGSLDLLERSIVLLDCFEEVGKNPKVMDARNLGQLIRELGNIAQSSPSDLPEVREHPAFSRLCAEVEDGLQRHSFDMKALSMMVWGFSKLGITSETLINKLGLAVLLHVKEFDPVGLSSVCWGFALLGLKDRQLFDAIFEQIREKRLEFNIQSVCNIASSFAMLGFTDDELFNELSKMTMADLPRFQPRDFSSVSAAFGRSGWKDDAFFGVLSREIQRKIDLFEEPADISDTAWGFGEAGFRDVQLFSAFSRAVFNLSNRPLEAPQIAGLAWAFAALNIADDRLFTVLSAVSTGCAGDFSPHNLSRMAWAYAVMNIPDRTLLVNLLESAVQRLDQFPPADLTRAAWAFAYAFASTPDLSLLVDFLESSRKQLRNRLLTPEEGLRMHQALAAAGLRKHNEYDRGLREYYSTRERAAAMESPFNLEVRKALGDLPCKVEPDFLCAGVMTDFKVTAGGVEWIVLCDDPALHHVGMNSDERHTGTLVLQDKIFKRNGFSVLHIPLKRWQESGNRTALLAGKLGIAVN